MRPSAYRIVTAACVLAWLGGCAPQPQLSVPVGILSEDWTRPTTSDRPAGAVETRLAELLGDAELRALTARAQTQNPDLAIAAARLGQARARLAGARAAALPDISISSGINQRLGRQGATKLDFATSLARVDVSWDPDLFGRLRAERLSETARFEAAQWEQRQIALSIEAELARAWVERAVLARRADILDAQIKRAAELERIMRVRFDAGDATRVDLGLQSIRLLDLRRDRTRIVQSLDETRTAIAVLVGAEAPLFQLPNPTIASFSLPEIAIPAPAIMLQQRPDVRAVESLIAAANGDVAAARARFFPSLRLSLAGLAEAISGSPLTRSVTAGADLLAPIFARGALTRDFKVAEAAQVESVETYRRTVLTALQEVENLMTARDLARERMQLVEQILAEAQITQRLGNAQFLSGEEDLLTLLDAEELLGDAEEARVLVWQEAMFAQIGLYLASGGPVRAQGGDWNS